MNKIVLVMLFLFVTGCASYITETRTVQPDGTYTVESHETVLPVGETVAPVGEPYVGPDTPWVYYNNAWFYNGILYGFYGSLGWWPYGYYPGNYLSRPAYFYNNNYYTFYRNNPQYYNNFHNKYHGGQKWQNKPHNVPRNYQGHRNQGNVYQGQRNHRGNSGQNFRQSPQRGAPRASKSTPSRPTKR